MGKFDGKVMLELGTNVGSVDIVRYAKDNGAFVIVADYLPKEKSTAKMIADKYYDISTDDIPKLVEIVKTDKVNGVFSGVSEFNLRNAKKICDLTGLKFYYEDFQWSIFMDKGNFRELCNKHNIPTPKTFFSGNIKKYNEMFNVSTLNYPVIVKPTDSAANIGITVCKSANNIDKAAKKAFDESDSKQIIIEEFIDGIEISPTYVIQNGKCKLVCMGSKYAYTNAQGLKALAHAYIYPSKYLKEYQTKLDEKVKLMIKSQDLDNCTIFFQGIYKSGSFYFFESGLRMEGTAAYKITEAMCGQNFMHFLVDNAFGIETNYNIDLEDPSFGGKFCIKYSQIAKEGTICGIEGYEDIIKNPMVLSSEQRHCIGDQINEDGSLRQHMFRYVLSDSNIDNIFSFIKKIQNKVIVRDENGENMLLTDFDPRIMLVD